DLIYWFIEAPNAGHQRRAAATDDERSAVMRVRCMPLLDSVSFSSPPASRTDRCDPQPSQRRTATSLPRKTRRRASKGFKPASYIKRDLIRFIIEHGSHRPTGI